MRLGSFGLPLALALLVISACLGRGEDDANAVSDLLNAPSCEVGACPEPSCTNQCTLDSTRCANSGASTGASSGMSVQSCERGARGCTEWRTTQRCSPTETCRGDAGAAVCTGCAACKIDERRCVDGIVTGTKIAQSCVAGSGGCNAWKDVQTCGTNEQCASGNCVASACDSCTVDSTKCEGLFLKTCRSDNPTCTKWHTTTDCSLQGKLCIGNACGGTLPCDNCIAGLTECDTANQVLLCQAFGDTCTRWQVLKACGMKRCLGGTCM